MAMKPNTLMVFNYLKENPDATVTSTDLAEILGLEKRQVDGIFTSAIQRKELGERVPAEVENEDGTHKQVKFLKLTEKGLAFDPNAAEE